MDMTELIFGYYQGEKNTAFVALTIGIVFLLLTAVLFIVWYKSDQLVKGLTWTFLVVGLFWTLAGVGSLTVAGQKMQETQSLNISDTELRNAEVERMEKVFTTGVAYRVAMIMFSGLIIVGLIVILINPTNLIFKGIALGMLLFGAVGHTFEVFSMRKNKAYQEKVVEFIPRSVESE
jgi:disulfide bond formation protein DsbB